MNDDGMKKKWMEMTVKSKTTRQFALRTEEKPLKYIFSDKNI